MNEKLNITPVTLTTPQFVSWLTKWNEKRKVDHTSKYEHVPFEESRATEGQRYIKIHIGNSVTTFIDKTTGDVLKSASYKAPAKGVRGNIFNADNGLDCMGPYGPHYLRGGNIKFDVVTDGTLSANKE